MFSRDSLEQCMGPKKAAEFIIYIAQYGTDIEEGKLDKDTYENFIDDLFGYFDSLFKGEMDEPNV